MRSSKEKIIEDCKFAMDKILCQGYTTVTTRMFFQDVSYWLRHSEAVVRCKDCAYWQGNNGGYPHVGCKWREDESPDPDGFCSAGEPLNP